MTEKNDRRSQRRSLLTGMGAAAAGLAVGTANAETGSFEPDRHDLDAWMGEMPGKHRVYVDAASGNGGAMAMHFSRNILNAHQSAYDGEDSDYAMILCFRHAATVFGFGDSIWKKYGELFYGRSQIADPRTGEAPDVNLMEASDLPMLPSRGVTIAYLQDRGVQIAICNAATRGISRLLARSGFGEADDIYKELVAAAIPGSRFVPAGVMAVTRAQEYGYSVLVAG